MFLAEPFTECGRSIFVSANSGSVFIVAIFEERRLKNSVKKGHERSFEIFGKSIRSTYCSTVLSCHERLVRSVRHQSISHLIQTSDEIQPHKPITDIGESAQNMLVLAQSTCENVTFDLVCTVLHWTWPVWCLGLSVCQSVRLSVSQSVCQSFLQTHVRTVNRRNALSLGRHLMRCPRYAITMCTCIFRATTQ